MAQYRSKYAEYGFYVNGEVKKFSNGRYSTDSADEIAVLDKLADVERIDTEEPVKPAVQPQPTRKANANTSAK